MLGSMLHLESLGDVTVCCDEGTEEHDTDADGDVADAEAAVCGCWWCGDTPPPPKREDVLLAGDLIPSLPPQAACFSAVFAAAAAAAAAREAAAVDTSRLGGTTPCGYG